MYYVKLYIKCNYLKNVIIKFNRYFDASKNILDTIPVQICQMTSLRTLILSENQITKLPDTIGLHFVCLLFWFFIFLNFIQTFKFSLTNFSIARSIQKQILLKLD